MKKLCMLFGTVIALCVLLAASVNASGKPSDEVFRRGSGNVIALTFDDGPDETKTDDILSVLDEHGIKATFFMIGENAELYPEVAARVIEAGHEIGNHTYSHVTLSGLTPEKIERELCRAAEALNRISEHKLHFMRPPGGGYDGGVLSAAKKNGLAVALWSIDTLDWRHRSADAITREILENVQGGDIILMHDYVYGEAHTAEALRQVIPALKKRGYEFVTLSDMYENHRG